MCEEGRHLNIFSFSFQSPYIILIKCISNETAVFLFEKWQRLPYNEMISYEGGVPLSFM